MKTRGEPRDPQALARWYRERRGLTAFAPGPGHQEAGPTVFAPFEESTPYFGSSEHRWTVNFRVCDPAVMTTPLRAASVTVDMDPQECPHGRFARLHDPEGNPIEPWEPQ